MKIVAVRLIANKTLAVLEQLVSLVRVYPSTNMHDNATATSMAFRIAVPPKTPQTCQ